MPFKVTFEGWVVTSKGGLPDKDELGAHLDGVIIELRDLGFRDATVSADLDQGHVQISVNVQGEDWEHAQEFGSSVIRSAIHGAGGATPGWSIDWCRATIEKSLISA